MLTAALAALAGGNIILVVDNHDRENAADLVMSADRMTDDQMAFYLRHGSGIVCVPMRGQRADALNLPPMTWHNTDSHAKAFTVSTDHVATRTGISAADRALTVRALADPATSAQELRRPGHIFPLRANARGVLERGGHTEAAVDMLELAGETPIGAITELVGHDGNPLRGKQVSDFARLYDLVTVSIDDVRRARISHAGGLVTCQGRAALPLAGARFTAACYTSVVDGADHFALILGDVAMADAREEGVLVRVHSECVTGDVFGSLGCDCGDLLQQTIDSMIEEGSGVVVYLRGHRSRSIELSHMVRDLAEQERGGEVADTIAALGFPPDSREYDIAAAIVADLGIRKVRSVPADKRRESPADQL